MKKIYLVILLCVGLFFQSCSDKKNAKVDEEFAKTADVRFELMKIREKYKANSDTKLTDAIKEYESLTDINAKIGLYDKFIKDGIISVDNEAAAEAREARAEAEQMRQELAAERAAERQRQAEERQRQEQEQQKKKTGRDFGIDWFTYVDDNDFDLAIRSNDAFVQQVKTMNSYFKELDASTLDAISFYEGLNPQQKQSFFLTKNVQQMSKGLAPQPIPLNQDVFKNYVRNNLQGCFDYMKQNYYQDFNRYYFRRYLNEFPQGYKSADFKRLSYSDNQFDLKQVAHK